MKLTRHDLLFFFSLLCALWFAVMGIVWVYGAALFVAYPIGLISLLLWLPLRKENRRRNRIIPIILVTGLVVSLSFLVGMLIWN